MVFIHAGERFNGYSHLAATLLALAGGVYLLDSAVASGDVAYVAGVAVFVMCAVALYAASTLYHCARGGAKPAWERADHCAIYLMVAGSYTPFAVMAARDLLDWTVLAFMWALALHGIRREYSCGSTRVPPLWIFLGMGWMGVVSVGSFAGHLGSSVLAWLLAGAVLYSAGTVFYRNRKGWVHAHGTWHVFVMAGSACHFVSIGGLVRLAGLGTP